MKVIDVIKTKQSDGLFDITFSIVDDNGYLVNFDDLGETEAEELLLETELKGFKLEKTYCVFFDRNGSILSDNGFWDEISILASKL